VKSTLWTRAAHALRIAAAAAVIGFSGAAIGVTATANAAPVKEITQAVMVGDPVAAAKFWQRQTLDDDCVLMAVADVVGELSADLPSEDEMIELAGNTRSSDSSRGPVYTPSQTDDQWGTSYRDAVKLLAHYGIDAYYTDDKVERKTHKPASMEALMHELSDGERVIVGLNGPTIWEQSGNRTEAAHAVVVTGVDTANNIVHVNDPDLSKGADYQVPMATFVKAWETGPHIMIVTDEAA